MAESAGRRLCLSEMVQQTTEALSLLDTAAIERLLGELKAVDAGEAELSAEPAEAILQRHKVLGAVLGETEKNLKVLGRLHALRDPQAQGIAFSRRGRAPWGQ